MKITSYVCDRCGKAFRKKLELIQGVSDRCVERTWDICPECLKEFHEFMENKK